MLLGALHQRTDDALAGMEAAEAIVARGGLGLVVEDRRMARMRDELGQIVALRQMPGERRGGIERHHPRADLEQRRNIVRSDERRVGKAWGRTCRHRWSPSN